MSADPSLILEVTPPGHGYALDLGGGEGGMRQPLDKLGYTYINLDVRRVVNGEPSVVGDAHVLPFRGGSFELVVSKDTLEHFLQPWTVVKEIHRVLKPRGLFILWVPFMHPFHGNDFYRYTPLGLRRLLGSFEILQFESPLWVLTVFSMPIIEALKRVHLGFLEQPIKKVCH